MITPDTVVQVSLAIGLPLAGGIIIATWRAANYLRDMRDEVAAIRKQMASVWTVSDMERWAVKLERANRNQDISVPDPLEIRSEQQPT
ncbi:MAG TPA: hypothetical protein VK139_07305 [Microbacteriaceae bacterium]|nr:hypothetical protein [Microbacteriaceae bacterium]